jgi:hypothetical protein
MKITEAFFKERVIETLLKLKLSIIDLHSGTFDIFIDEGKRLFLELKIANLNYKPYAKEIGINLTPQTKALRALNKLPIILSCSYKDLNECYLITPKRLKILINDRINYPTLAIGIEDSVPKVTFNRAIKLLIKEING